MHSFSTMAFSPSGPDAVCTFSPSNSLDTPFGSAVISPMEENGLAPLKDRSESANH